MATTITDRLQGLNSGLGVKAPVKVATTANITLSDEQTIDGVSIVTGDRVLVKNQTTGSENGIYVCSTGDWARAKDFNGTGDAVQGTLIPVAQGTVSAGFLYEVTTATFTIGTTALTFTATASTAVSSLAAEIAALYAIRTDITGVNDISADVTAVADISADVTIVAAVDTEIAALAPVVSDIPGAAGITTAYPLLVTIGGLTPTDGNVIVGNGSTWVAESGATARASLGLTIGTDVQAYDADTAKTNVAQSFTAAQGFAETTLTDAATISWDLSANQVAKVTLTDNRTLGAPTNQVAGKTYILRVIQDGGGGNTLAYHSTYKFPGGIAPTLSTGGGDIDILTFVSDGTNMHGVFQGDFS